LIYWCTFAKTYKMKNTFLKTFFLAAVAFCAMPVNAQLVPLYVGSNFSSDYLVVDTTGAAYTVIDTRTFSSDAGPVFGCFGLSLDPSSGDMYVLYNTLGGEERNLGVLDTLTGSITDIGVAGNLTDITFVGSTLYGTTGSIYVDYKFVEVNILDASITDLFTHISNNYGPAIGYDYFNNSILKFDRDEFTRINADDLSEEIIPSTGHPGECHAVAMKNATTALVTNYSELYELDLLTNTFTFVFGFADNVHAMAFGNTGLAVLSSGPSTFCSNDPSTLLLTSEGDSYQWYLDGEEILGATDDTYIPTENGLYSCVLDGEEANGVTITILPAPEVSFTATPNPIDLSEFPSGSVSFVNTTVLGDLYSWDFDNGFFTALENPSFSFNEAGSYDVVLTVTDSETGCVGTATETVVVIGSAGIEANSLSGATIYPVPSNDFVVLDLSGLEGQFQIQLMDFGGRIIEIVSVVGGTNHNFDLSELENGTYLITVSNLESSKTFQVVKQ